MSSSRVQTIFTGSFAALATCTASRTKSEVGVARRPKPPPRNRVWISTCSGLRPVIWAAVPWSTVWNCVPVQISHSSAVMRTVQLSGSIGAWARYGRSYSASTTFAAVFSAAAAIARGLGLDAAGLRRQRRDTRARISVGVDGARRRRGPTRRRGRRARAWRPRSARRPPRPRRHLDHGLHAAAPSARARRRSASPCRRSTASARRARCAGRGSARPCRSGACR